MSIARIILGNQLFEGALQSDLPVFMCEDWELCTHFRYHKHKIVFFLSAMREYADRLKKKSIDLTYVELTKKPQFFDQLEKFVKSKNLSTLQIYEVEDKFFEDRIRKFCRDYGLEITWVPTPMFLVSRPEFQEYLASVRKPFMKSFYESLRKRRGILVSESGDPTGGRWSLDSENRKKMPKDEVPPPILKPKKSAQLEKVKRVVAELFSDHPGEVESFWLGVRHSDAQAALKDFVENRLQKFGPYQDAISKRNDFNYHSLLSPYLNAGLLTPADVLDAVLEKKEETPIASLEGFVRQLIGWREFVRGIYQNFSEVEETTNFFGHERLLTDHWYQANTGLEFLDDSLQRALRYSYNHHIERLMILSNMMLLCQVHPREVHRWFMEMYVDSSDWVMGPNVYGMGQFSDGGLFATKPYIAGSNYILKMSDYAKGEWCEVVDGLFWSFVDQKRAFFVRNPRMSVLVKNLDRMDQSRKKRIFSLARNFQERVTG